LQNVHMLVTMCVQEGDPYMAVPASGYSDKEKPLPVKEVQAASGPIWQGRDDSLYD